MAPAIHQPAPRHPVISAAALRRVAGPVPCIEDGNSFVLTRSGRSAIVLALRAAGLGRGATVLLPDYYCPTMVAAVEHVGAEPAFYPVLEDRTADLAWLERQAYDRPTAVLAAHFFGLPVDMRPLRHLCDQRGALLVEDCAHAYFGSFSGLAVGQTGDFAIASLPKFFPVLEGGLLAWKHREVPLPELAPQTLASDAKAVYNALEAAAAHGRLPAMNGLIAGVSRTLASRRHARQDRSSPESRDQPDCSSVRLEALADPLLDPQQIRRSERWLLRYSNRERIVRIRRENYRYLARRFLRATRLRLPFPDLPTGAVPYCLPVVCPDADALYPRLRAANLPVYRWDRYWPGHRTGRPHWGKDLLQVSCHQDLNEDDLDYLASMITGD